MKNIRIRSNLFFLLLFVILSAGWLPAAHGQDDAVLIHTDKSFYVNGEVIWYSLYLPAALTQKNIAVKAVMFNEQGRELDYVFQQTDNGAYLAGYYKVPFDARTGYYRLAFRSLRSDNREVQDLGDIILPVYNDNDIRGLQRELVELPAGSSTAADPGLSDLDVRLSLRDAQPGFREEVVLDIAVTDKSGASVPAVASVAVTNWSLVGPALGNYAGTKSQPVPAAITAAPHLLDQWYRRTRVVDEKGDPRMASVIGVWSGAEQRMYFSSRTDEQGVSLLKLPFFTGEKDLQYLGYEKEATSIRTQAVPETAAALTEDVLVTPGLLTYLEKSQQRKKIFQYYRTLEFDLNPQPRQLEVQNIRPNQTYRIRDFEAFDNFATFFQENLSPLRFLEDRENNRYMAYIYNPRNNRRDNAYEGRPLFLIDGKATRNADFIGRLDLGPVDEVKIFFRPEQMRSYFNVMGNSGVVSISLRGEDKVQLPAEDERNLYPVSGFQRPAAFPVFRPDALLPGQPFFRPQLFWQAGVPVGSAGEPVRYYQSDAAGTFRIEVVVQDEQGRRGYQTLEYEVAADGG